MNPSSRYISDLILERYIADALDATTRSRVDALLARSPADSERLKKLLADSKEFLQRHPPEELLGRFRAGTVRPMELNALVARLTRMTLEEAHRPEAPYISLAFVKQCVGSQQVPRHALQNPGFNTQGDSPIARFIVTLEGLLSTVAPVPQRMFLLERLLHPETQPHPEVSKRAMEELAAELLDLVEKHPDLPAELKPSLAQVIEKLKQRPGAK